MGLLRGEFDKQAAHNEHTDKLYLNSTLALRQNPIEVKASVGFFLCFQLPQSISKPHFRRRKDDDTPSINIPMVGKNIRHRRLVMFS